MATRTPFNARAFYTNTANALNPSVKVKLLGGDGESYRLKVPGLPLTGGAEGVAQHCETLPDVVKVAGDKLEVSDGRIELTPVVSMTGKTVAEFVRGVASLGNDSKAAAKGK